MVLAGAAAHRLQRGGRVDATRLRGWPMEPATTAAMSQCVAVARGPLGPGRDRITADSRYQTASARNYRDVGRNEIPLHPPQVARPQTMFPARRNGLPLG